MVNSFPPGLFRRTALRLLTHPWVLERAAARSGGRAAIFMLHRFTEPGGSPTAFATDTLRTHLKWLRKEQYRLVGLETLVDELREGRPIPPRTVVVTVDDGYADFLDLAVPIFVEFDCPATVFVVTDFLDGRHWPWWDRIKYAVLHTRLGRCQVGVNGTARQFAWSSTLQRESAADSITESLKYMPAAARDLAIQTLLAQLEVELPLKPTVDFAPMRWDQLRSAVSDLISAGPHTVTHPILAMEDSETATREIADSWVRLKQEIPSALPIFCYPNGDGGAFSDREIDVVEALGLKASVSTRRGYVAARDYRPGPGTLRSPLPRLSLEGPTHRFVQLASGVERLKSQLRRNL